MVKSTDYIIIGAGPAGVSSIISKNCFLALFKLLSTIFFTRLKSRATLSTSSSMKVFLIVWQLLEVEL